MGYPTANIAVPDGFEAANGVYAARVHIDGDKVLRDAMANLGVKPTFGGSGRILELHLFGFDGDLYGRELTIELAEFIRPEQKFSTPGELRAQIGKDEKHIKQILKCI